MGTFVVASCLAGNAVAQPAGGAPPGGGRDRSNSQFKLRREEAGGSAGAAGRAHARAGDCAAALGEFDAALRTSIEPTLHRDRGLCHEKLGHPYPAAEDFRAYLVARPDAPDADAIRTRLRTLEVELAHAGSEAVHEEDAAAYRAEIRGSVSASSSSSSQKTHDEYLEKERAADLAEESALRRGKGLITGIFLHIPRYFFSDGNTSDMAYAVGGTLRYALGTSFVLLSELGYAGVGASGSDSAAGGPLVFLGAEVRLPLSSSAGDQLFFGAGADYERYKNSVSRTVTSFILARGRAGYRHVFGPSVGLEAMIDGGPGTAIHDPGSSTGVTAIGGSVAVLFAF